MGNRYIEANSWNVSTYKIELEKFSAQKLEVVSWRLTND